MFFKLIYTFLPLGCFPVLSKKISYFSQNSRTNIRESSSIALFPKGSSFRKEATFTNWRYPRDLLELFRQGKNTRNVHWSNTLLYRVLVYSIVSGLDFNDCSSLCVCVCVHPRTYVCLGTFPIYTYIWGQPYVGNWHVQLGTSTSKLP